jgi:chromosome segregation ATPase
VVRNSVSIQAQIEQVEKDLVAAEKEMKEFDLRLRRQFRCGNDLLAWQAALVEARERLKALESSNAEAAKVEVVKAEIAKYEGYFRELANENVPNPINIEKAPEVINAMKRKIADLRAQRDALKEELRERNVPAKKAH